MPSPNRLRNTVLACLVISLAATVPYLGVLESPYVFDDVKLVKDNELLRVSGDEAYSRFWSAFDITSRKWEDEELRENYRPLRFVSYYLDYKLSEYLFDDFQADDPPTLLFHVQNIIWHLLNSLLVFAIGRHLLGSFGAGLVLALLFALHPVQTEAVTFISSRRDVLSTFFFLASILAYLRSPPGSALRYSSLILAPPLFFLGFYAKEMVITLPAILFCIDLARRAKLEWRRIVCHAMLWVIAGFFIWATVSNEALIAAPVGGDSAGPAGFRSVLISTVLTASRYVMRYLAVILLPLSQSIDYSYDALPASRGLLTPISTLLSIAGVGALSLVALWALWKKHVVLSCGLLWFLIGLTPVLQFVPIPERFAERFVYLPSIGILLCVAALFPWMLSVLGRRGAWASASVVIAILFSLTVSRNGDWTTRLTLWEAAVREQPRAARAHLAYGNALKDLREYRLAADAYSHALAIWRENPKPTSLQRGQALQARMFRGGVYSVLGQEDPKYLNLAIEDLRAVLASTDTDGKLVESSSEFCIIHFELASTLLEAGRGDEANEEYLRIIEIGEPIALVVQSYYWLGKASIMANDIPAAARYFRLAIRALPEGDPSLFGVSVELADLLSNLEEDHERAWQILERLLAEQPPRDVRVAIHLRMARILDRKGEVDFCIVKLREALAIDPESESVLLTLASIEANLGRFDEAKSRYQAILRRDPLHVEARESLKAMMVQQKVGGEEKTPEAENQEVLRGLISRARKMAASGELLAARDVYSQLLHTGVRLDDKDATAIAYCGLAETEEHLGRPSRAKKYFLQAEAVAPDRPETLLRFADYCHRLSTEPTTARDYYLRYIAALAAEGVDPRAYMNLGDIYFEQGQSDLALRNYSESQKRGIDKVLGDAAHLLDRRIGYLHAKKKQWRKAYDHLQKYLDASEKLASADQDGEEYARVLRFIEDVVLQNLIENEEE